MLSVLRLIVVSVKLDLLQSYVQAFVEEILSKSHSNESRAVTDEDGHSEEHQSKRRKLEGLLTTICGVIGEDQRMCAAVPSECTDHSQALQAEFRRKVGMLPTSPTDATSEVVREERAGVTK
eukprot:SAG31_NODE_465_length_15313_cov_10.762390_4_plen_122_part_00